MATVKEAPPAPPETPAPRPRGWVRALRLFGIACLMVATGVLGYAAWLLWGTGLETQRAQNALHGQFDDTIGTKPVSTVEEEVRLPGQAYAEIRIPAIDVDFIVVEGTDYASLKKGPGHYPDTADPWDKTGRVGIAGHRTTYLHPFYNLGRLTTGDDIVLRTEAGTFTYDVTQVFVIPSSGSGRVLNQTTHATLVLTTCNPKYSSSQRLIVTADLVEGA